MILHGIEIPRERIEAFCHANGIRRLALFGSVLHDDFRPESDVDVLIEFQPGVRVGLAFIRMQDELSTILGHKVDLTAAVSWVSNCCRGYRLPEPTRLAHLAASGNLRM